MRDGTNKGLGDRVQILILRNPKKVMVAGLCVSVFAAGQEKMKSCLT